MKENCFTLLRYLFAFFIFFNHLYATTGEEPFICNVSIFVCGFFVISGFLNFNSYRKTPVIKTFASKRFIRIYPAYFLTILLCLIGGSFLTTFSVGAYWGQSDTWLYLLYNLLFLNFKQPTLPGVFEGNLLPYVNGALWTMKVEVLFYISVPVVHWLMQRFGESRTLITLIACSMLYNYATDIAYWHTHNELFYTLNHQIFGELSYFYLPALMLYKMEWVRRHGKLLMWTSFVLLIPFFFSEAFRFVLPFCIPVLVVTFAYECKWLLWTAKIKDISYEFYLIHFPILQTCLCLYTFPNKWEVAAIVLPITFVLSILLHRLCPKPHHLIT